MTNNHAMNPRRALTAPEYLTAIRRDGELLVDLATRHPGAAIPTCPDWDTEALLGHMGEVYNMVANMVERRAAERSADDVRLEAPAAGNEAAWCAALHTRLVDVLNAADPDEPMWTWAEPATVGFYHRRMAHETAVHLADMQAGAGLPVSLDSELAADGVDELIEMVYLRDRPADQALTFPAESLHLHRTDGDGEWMFTTADGVVNVTREHGKGDAAVRGTGPELLLFVWGRGIGPACEVFGDRAVAEAWGALAP